MTQWRHAIESWSAARACTAPRELKKSREGIFQHVLSFQALSAAPG
jgi:hypothetical protein